MADGIHPDFVEPCPVRKHSSDPDPPEGRTPLALTFSGGGFRATFTALGIVRYLADADRLDDVRLVSSVSGGSVAAGLIAHAWPALRADGFSTAAVERHVIEPTRKRISESSLATSIALHAWKALGEETLTDVLVDRFTDWFFGDTTMADLDPGVRWVINGANLGTGTRFTFERDLIGDYVNGFADMPNDFTLATAVAASAAVPGPFSPMSFDDLNLPCRDRYEDSVAVMDGGIYDNTALEAIDGNSGSSSRYDNHFSISAAVGGVLQIGSYGSVPIVRHLLRSNSVLYRQSRNLRTRDMVNRFKLGERKGILFKLNTTIPSALPYTDALAEFTVRYNEQTHHDNKHLALISTSFDEFDTDLCDALIRRGWWLTGAIAAAYHPDEMPIDTTVIAP